MKKKVKKLFNSDESKFQYAAPIIIIGILMLAVLGAQLVNTAQLHEHLQQKTIEYGDDVSAQLANNISARMKMRETYIDNLADTFEDIPNSQITKELLIRKAAYLDMEEVFIINADGTTIPNTKRHSDIISKIASTKELYDGSHSFFAQNDVYYSAPINRKNGQKAMLIGVRTNETLQKMLKEVDFNDQGISCIVDKNGQVIVSATEIAPFLQLHDIFNKDPGNEDIENIEKVLSDIENHQSGVTLFKNIGGQPVMLAYDFLNINDWVLLTLLPTNIFSSGSDLFIIRFGLITVVMGLVMGCIFIVIVWNFRRYITKLQTVALIDPLTREQNFLAFQMEGEKIVNGNSFNEYAILFLNLKNFKRYNERFGVAYGDSLLKKLHFVISSCLEDDEMISRANGDHFYLLLKCNSEEAVKARLNKILHEIENMLSGNFAIDRSNFLIGANLIKDNDVSFLVLADRAKIASAHNNINEICHFYDETLRFQIAKEQDLDESFENALKNHEFKLYIQPKVSTKPGFANGGEVLVRWLHPVYGLLFPNDFIPLFERNGKICDLDFYMFEQACILTSSLLKEGKSIPLSINLSRAHLISDDLSFLDQFKAIKDKYNIPDGLLELELTESLMLENREASLITSVIDKIISMGMLCSMDDFGFGYSSLTLLKDLKVSTVKLDRGFFLNENNKTWLVVKQLISLAHDLNMQVVAEGIEDFEQVQILTDCSCDFIQGYVYSKPIPVQDFLTWYENNLHSCK